MFPSDTDPVDHGPQTLDHHPLHPGDLVLVQHGDHLTPLRIQALHAIRGSDGFVLWAVEPVQGSPCVWAHDCLHDPERWRRTRVKELARQIQSREAELAPLRREYETLIAQAMSEGGCDA